MVRSKSKRVTFPTRSARDPRCPVKKLIIQMTCYNEEEALPITLAALPRQVDGFERVEWLVVSTLR